MEYKTLFYVIAFIAWMIFKFFESQKGILKKLAQKMEPPVVTPVIPQQSTINQKPKRVSIVKKLVKQEKNKTVVPIVEKKQTKIVTQIKKETQDLELPEIPTFIDEIRSGNVDWRKAILLSEILRPV